MMKDESRALALYTRCALCRKKSDTRPFGPQGERVCYDCAMKNESAARRQFSRLVRGVTLH